jgi:hypothetical protein
MNKDEQEIIARLQNDHQNAHRYRLNPIRLENIQQHCTEETIKHLENLMNKGLGKRSYEFFKFMMTKVKAPEHIMLWMQIEVYLHSEATDDPSAKIQLDELDAHLKQSKQLRARFDGLGSLSEGPMNRALIKNIYLSNHKKLIDLFSTYVTIPDASLFAGHSLPPFFEKRERDQQVSVRKFEENNLDNFTAAMNAVLKIQRFFRGRRRHREEVMRIRYFHSFGKSNTLISNVEVKDIMSRANTPYRPEKCSNSIADRIVKASKQVELFSTIKHLTSTAFITNIFDTALFGRRTLHENHIEFRPAALTDKDIFHGDLNAICFGPYAIDERCLLPHTTEITLDLRKLIVNNKKNANRSIFFKQNDFGYYLSKRRRVLIGHESLSFSHTEPPTKLSIFHTKNNSDEEEIAYHSNLPHYHFIAYDLEKIHQILALNFFRFIDSLEDSAGNKAPNEINRIYNLINTLDDNELIEFLTVLGTQMTDTCEFNFYGAYRIDFDLILTIKAIGDDISNTDAHYTLNLVDFITELKKGNLKKLAEAKNALPNVFKSTRFIEYLLSKVDHPDSCAHLLQQPDSTLKSVGNAF